MSADSFLLGKRLYLAFQFKRFLLPAPSWTKTFFAVLSVVSLLLPQAQTFAASGQPDSRYPHGVVAVNTDMADYLPGQSVHVQMGALDSQGHTLCGANLQLQILDQAGNNLQTLSTQSGTILRSQSCGDDNVTDNADYYTYLAAPEEVGTYKLQLVNLDTGAGVLNYFSVQNSLPFLVRRESATRINPFKSGYRVNLEITALQNFTGQAEEYVSGDFSVSNFGSAAVSIVRDKTEGSAKKISWPVSMKAGESAWLSYDYVAPQVSPEIFQIGFLQIRSATLGELINGQKKNFSGQVLYAQQSGWQIASDASAVKSGNFTAKTTTGTQSITGLGFQPKAIIFYYTFQNTDNAFLNTGASGPGSAQASMGMGIASQTGSATSSRSVAIVDDSTGTNGTTSDSKQRISSTSTIMLLSGGLSTVTAPAAVMARAVVTSMDADGFTLNWSTATATAAIIRYFAIGGSDITNATTNTFTLGTGSSSLQSITNVGFAPDFVFYLSADTATYDGNIADANLNFGFSTAATSTQQGVDSFATNDAAGTGVSRNTQTTASSTAALSSAVTAVDYAFRTWSLDNSGFTINVGNTPAASVAVFYLAIQGGQFFVGSTSTPAATGNSAVTGVGFKPQGLFVSSNGLAASNAVQNNAQMSIGTAGWATTTGVSATSSMGQIGISDANGDTLPSQSLNTNSNVLVKGYTPTATDNTNPAVTFSATPATFDSDGFTLNYSSTASGKQILYWAVGDAPNISGNVYSDEGITGLASSRTIKLIDTNADATASSTYSTTTVASTGRFDFFNVPYGRGDTLTFYLDNAAEKADTVVLASSSPRSAVSGISLFQNENIFRSENVADITIISLAAFDWDNDSDMLYSANGGSLTATSSSAINIWAGDGFSPGGSVSTTATSASSSVAGDFIIQTGAQVTMGTNPLNIGGDLKSYGTLSVSSGQTTSFTGTGSGFYVLASSTTFDTLTFSGSGGSWNLYNNSTVTVNSDLNLSGGGGMSFNVGTTSLSVVGNLTIGSNSTFSAPTGTLTLSGNLNVAGTFTHNNGTVVFAPTSTSTVMSSSSMTFYNLSISSPGKELRFQHQVGYLPVFTIAHTLTVAGSAGSPVYINSELPGYQWLVYFGAYQSSIQYASMKDSGCSSGPYTANLTDGTSVNRGATDACWQFVGYVPPGGGGGGSSNTPAIESGSGGGSLVTGGGSSGDGSGATDSTDGGSGGGSGSSGGGAGGGGGGSSP